ncbi:MAG: hypothetical protein PHZ23_15170 [Acidiphilium sp.]|nr:hypothetical protein [Acidiphilium sp.]
MNQFVATRMDLEVMGAENRQHFGQIESDVSVIKSTLSSNENRMDGMSRHIAGIEGWGQLSAKVFIGLCVALGSAGFLTAAGYFWTNFITH